MDDRRVVIVGGGVIGTMHALEGVRRGWEVVQLEADAGPRRASVRNFGLVWVSGRAVGEELELGLRARELWEATAAVVPGVGFRADGSVTVATDQAELALMQEVVARPDGAERQLTVLDADGVRRLTRRCGEECSEAFCAGTRRGGGAGRRPSGAAGAPGGRRPLPLAPAAAGRGGGTGVRGRPRGRQTPGLAGARLSGRRPRRAGGTVGAALGAAPLRRCRLQMMQTAAAGERLATSIADGDSMRYYPGFDVPGRGGLAPASPETVSFGMQLLLVQRAAGGLTIGDTHVYEEPFDFAVEEFLYDRLRQRAEDILGWRLPPVVRRWAGVYSAATDTRVCFREEVEPGVVVVTGLAGRGMTLSPAVAEQTWTELSR